MGDFENRTMPDRNRTYTAIWDAVRSGKIKRRKCRVCGDPKTQAHHPGTYKGTKNITWLCRKHHNMAHGRSKKQVSKSTEIIKSDGAKQVVSLIAAKPDELDADEQWFEREDIEQMAHRFLVNYRLGKADIYLEHRTKRPDVFLVGSEIASVDYTLTDSQGRERQIRAGTWIVQLWIPNLEFFEEVVQKRMGVSPRGPGVIHLGETLPELDASRYERSDERVVV